MQATRRRGQEGVTFVELAVTAIIVGLLAALAIPPPWGCGTGRATRAPSRSCGRHGLRLAEDRAASPAVSRTCGAGCTW
jgi:Tfp pilus assembly protein PilE